MAKETKKDKKNKKHFFKDFKAELKKVIWPTPKQLVNKTIAVVVIVIITATIVFVLDLLFGFMNNHLLNNLKTDIKNSVTVENVLDDSVEEDSQEENETEENETTESNEVSE